MLRQRAEEEDLTLSSGKHQSLSPEGVGGVVELIKGHLNPLVKEHLE
jgi:hypothetical protein